MNKLIPFVRLDFMTVKPYYSVKNLLLYAAVALFMTLVSQNVSSAMGVGMMLGTMFVGYPFAVGEKSNMDALYATMSVDRNTVVLGRYLFTLLLNLCAVLFSYALAVIGLLAANAFGIGTGLDGPVTEVLTLIALTLSVIFMMVQSIQLPIYFKLGYTKAKFLSIIPFAAIMAGYFVLLSLGNVVSGLDGFLTTVLESGFAFPLAAAVLILFVFVSFRLSVSFYKKREF